MQNARKFIVIFLLLFSFISRAQDPEVIQRYIQTYKDLAIEEMQRTGVPAAIKLAQGIHETFAGTSVLVMKSNNHFGIKCKDTWTGATVRHDDDARQECFRKYPSAEDSYRDHSDFLKNSGRYASLFELDPTDYEGWARGLKKAGYATNPRYPVIIIKLIEDYHLQDYTMIALGKMPARNDGVIAAVETQTEPHVNEPMPILTVVKTAAVIEQPSYPEGEFTINETRVIYARKGTSFLAIAQQYNLPLARIFEFNDMPPAESLNNDQLIYLQRKRKTGNNEFHIVGPEETVYDIAQKEAIRLETLLEYNFLKTGMKPAIGEQLHLRSQAAAAPRLAVKEINTPPVVQTSEVSHPAAANFVTYTVQPKETIYTIARRHSVKIEDIVKWNQLSGYELKTGQQLKIYK